MADAGARSAAGLRRIGLSDGAELHFSDVGSGSPIVLVHGGGRDLRAWLGLSRELRDAWRVVAPSRRYCWPNRPPPLDPAYSPVVDAGDLRELLDSLAIARAVFVGSSMGAAALLHFAVAHADRVVALSLAEPPIHGWAARTTEGSEELRSFLSRAWRPAGNAFERGQPEAAMRILIDHFLGAGSFDRLLPPVRTRLMENSADFEAQTRALDAFPDPGRERVAGLTMPVQMLSGERTLALHRIVDDELASVLPHARRTLVPDAGHDVWADAGGQCTRALLSFFDSLAGT